MDELGILNMYSKSGTSQGGALLSRTAATQPFIIY